MVQLKQLMQTLIPMSESDRSFGRCTDKEEAAISRTERLSFSETSSIPARYIFEPSDTESDGASENCSDESVYNTYD